MQLDIFESNAIKKSILSKDPKTRDWFTAFSSAKIDPQRLKNFVANKFEISLSDVSATIVATATKIFIGEVVEEARRLSTNMKLNGPI